LLNLDFAFFSPAYLEFWAHIDYLKGGLVFADAITTVSRRYAEEICTAEFGHGLDGVLRTRRPALRGILNGVDYDAWSPESDSLLPRGYSAADLSGKAICKRELQRELGLREDPEVPLLTMITRLVGQKGLDLVLEMQPALMQRNLQFAVLGTGDPHFEQGLRAAARADEGRVAVHIGFDEALAHRFQAGADMLLMPSRYEPCGLNQIYALHYGTVPVVRATGGLDDTVEDFNPALGGGNGFKFSAYTPTALLAAIDRARGWYGRRQAWQTLMRAGMGADFSWKRSAVEYVELYRSLTVG
jgi:starch synthase